MPVVRLSRRSMLAGLCLLPAAAAAAGQPRISALDWAIAATMLALGVPPAAVSARSWYDRIVVSPLLPQDTADAGLLNTPSFEFLQRLSPDHILIGPGLKPAEALLARIAPVTTLRLAAQGPDAIAAIQMETRRLASLLQAEPQAADLIARIENLMRETGLAVAGYRDRPLLVIGAIDDRHVLVQGGGSLFQAVLDRLDWHNAGAAFAPRAAVAVIGIEQLAQIENATVLGIDMPDRPAIGENLSANPFWNALPFVREGRFHRMASIYASGGLPAVERFLSLLPGALEAGRLG